MANFTTAGIHYWTSVSNQWAAEFGTSGGSYDGTHSTSTQAIFVEADGTKTLINGTGLTMGGTPAF
jgi:hypothetical protein